VRTTKPIENLKGSVAHYYRNVKRWVARSLSDAAGLMRKLQLVRPRRPRSTSWSSRRLGRAGFCCQLKLFRRCRQSIQ
jgi:hypothetical protein